MRILACHGSLPLIQVVSYRSQTITSFILSTASLPPPLEIFEILVASEYVNFAVPLKPSMWMISYVEEESMLHKEQIIKEQIILHVTLCYRKDASVFCFVM